MTTDTSADTTSITRRLMVGLALTVGMSSLLVVALLAIIALRTEDASMAREADAAVAEAASLLESPLWDLDVERATRIGEAYARDPRVALLTITEATSGATQSIRRIATADTAWRTHPVQHDGRAIGVVGIAFSRAVYRQRVWEQVRTALLVSLIAMAASLLGVRLLVRRVLRGPLHDLARVATAYGEDAATEAPSTIRHLEFQPVFSVLRAMGDRISGQLRDLHDANTRLELEVREREQAEANALRSRNMLAMVMDTVPMAIFWKDRDGVYLGGNMVFAALAGVSSVDEIVGRTDRELLPAERAAADRASDTVVMSERRIRYHVIDRQPAPDGTLRWLDTTRIPLVAEDGEVMGVLGVARDITLDRQRDEQLLHVQKLEAVGQLAGGIAHDFNNILGAILLELELLELDAPVSPEISAGIASVRVSLSRAARLTRQLLLFSRRQTMEVRTCDLNVVIGDLLQMVTRLIGENIVVEFEPSPAPALVDADTGMIEQVVVNLCVNARDAMPSGGRLVIATRHATLPAATDGVGEVSDEAATTPCVVLRVSDTGHGMSDETRGRIFEPFFTTKEVGKGSGLGLATTHGIVSQHHGHISVESVEGKGTTFEIALPASRAATPAATSASTPVVATGHESILVVEDEELLRTMMARALRLLGYRVVEAVNGPDALAVWASENGKIDLVLTDVVMPGGMSGLELAERLQVLKPGLEVVVMSGYSLELTPDGAGRSRAIHFLGKPFTVPAVSAMVRARLDAARSS